MYKRVIIIFFLLLSITQSSSALDLKSIDKQILFWPSIIGSSTLFLTGITLYIVAGENDDKALRDDVDPEKKKQFVNKANLYWILALTSIGGSIASGIFALKIKYEPGFLSLKNIELQNRENALQLVYHHNINFLE